MAKRRRFGRVFQRGPVWYVRIRTTAGEVKRAAGPSRKLAEALLAKLELAEARGEVLGVRDTPAVTLAEFRRTFEASRTEKAPGTRRADAGRYDALVKRWPHTPLCELTPADVEDFAASLVARKRCTCEGEDLAKCTHTGAAGATVNRYLALLSAIFKAAKVRGMAEANPCQGMRRRREYPIDVPVLTVAELERLAAHVPAPLRPAVVLAAETGCRRSELAATTWADVDLSAKPYGALLVRRGKSERGRRAVPLTARARAVVDALKSDRPPLPLKGSAPLLPALDGARGLNDLTKAVPRASVDAGLPRLRLHDLRHLYAVRHVRAGTPLSDVAALLGDTLAVVCSRYGRHVPANAGTLAVARLEAAESVKAEAANG